MEKEEEREEMSMFDETTIRAQRAARSGNWRLFKRILEEDTKRLLEPFDLFGSLLLLLMLVAMKRKFIIKFGKDLTDSA